MKVLVVVDLQRDFIDAALGTPEATAILPKVMEKVQNFPGLCLYTMDTHQEDYLSSQEGTLLPVPHCVEGQEGWQIPAELMELLSQKQAVAFPKATFGSVELGNYLCKLNETKPIEEIICVGLCTDICVISNALLLKAFLPEVKLTVDAACCAGTTPEAHENSLRAMRQCQIFLENWETP